MPISVVMLDFYGTLARATHWISIDDVLAEHGYAVPGDIRERWVNDGMDGLEHVEQSQSRDHYVAWQRERLLGMLAETDVHPAEYGLIVEKLRHGATASRVLEAYDEVSGALRELRTRDLSVVVCSNWDWDLAEAIEEAGLLELVDDMVSSAWAGARKPHPRIFRRALDQVGVAAGDAVFVGDTWGPDVEGPRAIGMRAVYLRRDGHWPDPGAPERPDDEGVAVVTDLRGLLDLV